MKNFHCDGCGRLVFFENVSCVNCGHTLGFLPDVLDLSALERGPDDLFQALTPPAEQRRYRACANSPAHGVCNWMVPENDANPLCVACRSNDVIPDLNVPENLARWTRIEAAKHRLVYTLLKLQLPIDADPAHIRPALRFRFLGDTSGLPAVTTGHENGVVTLNIAEADDEVREQRRVQLHEPFRTLIGHFRHEVSHYYWERLIKNSSWLPRFRELFGDENADYQAALQHHYTSGPPAGWAERYVSAYASVHPWEDWAETTAHYFHLIDAVETAASFGLVFEPKHPSAKTMAIDTRDAFESNAGFDELLNTWIPLTHALNAFNRGMGLGDLYPFVLCQPAVEKLRFIHEVLQSRRDESEPAANETADADFAAATE